MRKVVISIRSHNFPEQLTLVFDLFENLVPKTVERFVSLCTGRNSSKVSYKLAPITRVVAPEFIVQAGKIERPSPSGTQPSEKRLLDIQEYNDVILSGRNKNFVSSGLLCVAEMPEDSEYDEEIVSVSSPEFFITLQSLSQYEEKLSKYLVIGRLASDLDQFVDWMSQIKVDKSDVPVSAIWIDRCGELIPNANEKTEPEIVKEKQKRRKHHRHSDRKEGKVKKLRFVGEN
ncbi:unnamed protein product [Kuraishia capsulata CBS 1993]|uniref:Peptidyl-prolyl cis-trans isomerase n=1 Tax=Kuraishia capsulata CBS 1993 TaxID=1382522 RepID=W6MJX2_9ASCO|nr:uncharacterized protein KUCA_T00002813001 [Kuraishia capsulata CBS 1993]CDK26839.1 unnamed protein product [Kuraishia capsulata CBS 1993]